MTEDVKRQSGTVMIAAFDGWNDACQAATNVIRHLVKRYDSREIRHISCDGFYDYQVARPMMCHVTGRARIIWPQTTFHEITLAPDARVIAQIAPEPNYRWREYCRQSLHIAEELDIDRVVTLGAMFADCPHTRPLPVNVSSEDCPCEDDRQYNGPIGIPTVLDAMACESGFDTTSIWVSLPQYLGNEDCAPGTVELLRGLSRITAKSHSTKAIWRRKPSVGRHRPPCCCAATTIWPITCAIWNANTTSAPKPTGTPPSPPRRLNNSCAKPRTSCAIWSDGARSFDFGFASAQDDEEGCASPRMTRRTHPAQG